ncbi:MAG: oxidoreductase domain-containing protein [Candidatus Syntrophoarchaeum caldarius]|uniref:Oxidoreductase domain-containing protein n=1 Tax=Candidatus Syntropharchaeum caldarium TaxID=1838285 RepID=A0A1F2P8E2_9EURY|nr:MAG: oxidoreductase domain-containing protein [Candidatus Syntrophoarchaeum caldarius]
MEVLIDMNVGVIGAGSMGKNHVRVYSELKDVEEVYVYDPDAAKIRAVEKYGITACDSMDQLLKQVDLVSICVPTKYHYSVAKSVIEKGISCLIEKPLTLTVEEGEKLLQLLGNGNNGVVVGVGHIERFNPMIGVIKKMIKEPLYVDIRRHNPASDRITDASIVEDLMIHDIDIVFNVLFDGEYEIASAGNGDLCTTLIRFGSSVVSISASRRAAKKIRSIYIEEEDFTIEGDFMNQEVYVYRKPSEYGIENGGRYRQENIIEKVMVNKIEPLKEELKAFITCVKRGEAFTITPSQALKDLKICAKINKLNAVL